MCLQNVPIYTLARSIYTEVLVLLDQGKEAS